MNALYNSARVRMLSASFNWSAMSVVLRAYSGSYVFNEAHQFPSDILANGGVLADTSNVLASPSVTSLGAAVSMNAVFAALAIDQTITHLSLQEVGSPNKLIAFFDTGYELPFLTNGSEYTIRPDWLANSGWFRP